MPEYYDMDNQKWIRGADIEKTPRQLGLVEGVRLQIHDPEGFKYVYCQIPLLLHLRLI